MQTWMEHHPQWQYRLFDNQYLEETQFLTRPQIDEYLKRGQYAGAADLMRYEILYREGGLLPGADSICLSNTDELFREGEVFTIYENEFLRGKLVSPILACEPGNDFVKALIDELAKMDPITMLEPWQSTGNLFVAEMIERLTPKITIFPSHTMIPVHFDGRVYAGDGKVYAKQMFGSTCASYKRGVSTTLRERIEAKLERMRQSKYRANARARGLKVRQERFGRWPVDHS
ncbi:glycosyltransferase [Loktanella sp. S4079]|uniref:glycosyltransferase n=1 Tax=Loktanella sp. S4079 TaxID=579483 RepID=UPI0009FCBE84